MKIAVSLSTVLATFFTAATVNSTLSSISLAATPVCQTATSDNDGDGWGWENHRSCRVTDQTPTGSGNNADTSNSNNYGSNTTPLPAGFSACSNASADPDGDGWGWENNRSCVVTVTTQAGSSQGGNSQSSSGSGQNSNNTASNNSSNTNSSGYPPCSNSSFDEDRDGWGYENYRSCIVVTDTGNSDTTSNNNTNDNQNDKDDNNTGIIYSQQFSSAAVGLYQGDQLNVGWNTPLWHLGFDQGRVAIVRDGGGHGKVMKVTYPAGAYGANGASAFLSDVQFGMGLPKSYNELYLSYDVKFGDNFEFVLGGKLPGLCGSDLNQAPSTGCNTGGGYPSGYDGWSARSMWRVDGAMENYVYHAGQQNYYGDDELWNTKAQPGRWHRIQHRIVLNTIGQNNGILEAWFDGAKVLSKNHFVYRKKETIGINLFYFSTFFGGNDSSWAPSTDQHILFDNFVISTKPIN